MKITQCPDKISPLWIGWRAIAATIMKHIVNQSNSIENYYDSGLFIDDRMEAIVEMKSEESN